MEQVNCTRIIQESGITALCNIAVKYPTIPGISQPVAAAFQLLSSRPQARISIVQEGSVTAMASLLRFSVDMFTLQHCLLALCNLLSEPENHLSIVQQVGRNKSEPSPIIKLNATFTHTSRVIFHSHWKNKLLVSHS
jgi:hypothetical protein